MAAPARKGWLQVLNLDVPLFNVRSLARSQRVAGRPATEGVASRHCVAGKDVALNGSDAAIEF